MNFRPDATTHITGVSTRGGQGKKRSNSILHALPLFILGPLTSFTSDSSKLKCFLKRGQKKPLRSIHRKSCHTNASHHICWHFFKADSSQQKVSQCSKGVMLTTYTAVINQQDNSPEFFPSVHRYKSTRSQTTFQTRNTEPLTCTHKHMHAWDRCRLTYSFLSLGVSWALRPVQHSCAGHFSRTAGNLTGDGVRWTCRWCDPSCHNQGWGTFCNHQCCLPHYPHSVIPTNGVISTGKWQIISKGKQFISTGK